MKRLKLISELPGEGRKEMMKSGVKEDEDF
jgi:hypothetical protein